MTKAFITGIKGFIGSQLANSLKANGYEVSGIDDEYFSEQEWEKSLVQLVDSSEPEVIFHVGACSNTLETNANFMMIRNYESTKVLSNLAKENNIPFIYSSSAANYGTNGRYPSNLYGWSKYAAENLVSSSGGVSLRYFNVYGPGEENKGAMSSFLLQALKMKAADQKIKLFPGKPARDFIYIKDVLDANLYAHHNYSKLMGNFFEISTCTARTFEDVLDIAKIEFSYHEMDKVPKGYQFYTCGKKELHMPGWAPKFNLEDGIRDYLQDLSERG